MLKYDVQYFQCSECQFIQTETPYWLPEAYSSAITETDLGLASRNVKLHYISTAVLHYLFNYKGSYIDYGGGYGLFVRLMRDSGFDFYRYDIYCDNIFSKGFDVSNGKEKSKFKALTAFEVFEHLEKPLDEISKMFDFSDVILFTTELQPKKESINDWWYFTPHTGQHVALYSEKSLNKIANYFNAFLYTNGSSIHILSKIKLNARLLKLLMNQNVSLIYKKIFCRKSLLGQDHELILNNNV